MAVQSTSGNTVNVDEERLIQKIAALQPSKQLQKTRLFEKLYPAIQGALDREVPQKAIVEELASAGLKLSIGGFRALLAAMRASQGTHESGSAGAGIKPAK